MQDSRIRDSSAWNPVVQIQYPEIKKRCEDMATVLNCCSIKRRYCRTNKRQQMENESVAGMRPFGMTLQVI